MKIEKCKNKIGGEIKMNQRETLVFTAFTGVTFVQDFSDFHKYAEELMGRPILTHQFASAELAEQIAAAAKPEFLRICKNVSNYY